MPRQDERHLFLLGRSDQACRIEQLQRLIRRKNVEMDGPQDDRLDVIDTKLSAKVLGCRFEIRKSRLVMRTRDAPLAEPTRKPEMAFSQVPPTQREIGADYDQMARRVWNAPGPDAL